MLGCIYADTFLNKIDAQCSKLLKSQVLNKIAINVKNNFKIIMKKTKSPMVHPRQVSSVTSKKKKVHKLSLWSSMHSTTQKTYQDGRLWHYMLDST